MKTTMKNPLEIFSTSDQILVLAGGFFMPTSRQSRIRA